MTSEPEELLILKAWSSENVPCSISIASSFLSLSVFGKLRYDSRELSLNWPNGSLGLGSLQFCAREDSEDACTLIFRLEGEMEVRIVQRPDARSKVIH